MQIIKFAVLLFVSSQALATPQDLFKSVTYQEPKCYSAQTPKKKVTSVKATIMKYSADTSMNSDGLKLELKLAREPRATYRAEMSCFELEGKMHCGIECDGGSVEIASGDERHLTITNNGFLIHGGCDGEDEKTKFLEKKMAPKFELTRVRCQ